MHILSKTHKYTGDTHIQITVLPHNNHITSIFVLCAITVRNNPLMMGLCVRLCVIL